MQTAQNRTRLLSTDDMIKYYVQVQSKWQLKKFSRHKAQLDGQEPTTF